MIPGLAVQLGAERAAISQRTSWEELPVCIAWLRLLVPVLVAASTAGCTGRSGDTDGCTADLRELDDPARQHELREHFKIREYTPRPGTEATAGQFFEPAEFDVATGSCGHWIEIRGTLQFGSDVFDPFSLLWPAQIRVDESAGLASLRTASMEMDGWGGVPPYTMEIDYALESFWTEASLVDAAKKDLASWYQELPATD